MKTLALALATALVAVDQLTAVVTAGYRMLHFPWSCKGKSTVWARHGSNRFEIEFGGKM